LGRLKTTGIWPKPEIESRLGAAKILKFGFEGCFWEETALNRA